MPDGKQPARSCPLLLGSGKPLFDGKLPAADLKLGNAGAMDLGAVSLRYSTAT
jgi:hypothetical protein